MVNNFPHVDISTFPFLTRGLDAFHLIMDDNGWMGFLHSLAYTGETVGLVTRSVWEANMVLGILQRFLLLLQDYFFLKAGGSTGQKRVVQEFSPCLYKKMNGAAASV